jgi:UDP-glucose 4-epimerase
MNFPKARWFSLIRFNVDVSINLCQCAAALPDCHFIHVSTGLGYRDQGRLLREDDPLDTLHPYGASKAAADILVRSAAAEFGVPMTVLRPFSFTGRWDESGRLFPMLLRAAAEQRQLDLSPGLQVRDHCSACDIAAGIWAAVRTPPPSPRPARVFNLGSGNTTPLKELVQQVVAQLDLRVELNFGARDYSPHEPMHLAADTQLAQRELGWKPEHNLAHAVWELAREAFPQLEVREPSERI